MDKSQEQPQPWLWSLSKMALRGAEALEPVRLYMTDGIKQKI